MTDEFNFLGLPLVVQDLITNEIVHQSIPEDRNQLALTSQYCNYLVQRAKPKKIMDRFTILSPLRFTCRSNSRKIPKKQQLMKIVSNCQIKKVVMADETKRDHSNYAEFFNMLFEAAKFSTKFDIIAFKDVHMVEIVGFYTKLKHLRSVTIGKPEFTLPYYPSKVKLNFHPSDYFLRDLAEKSRNCPLSVLKLECGVNLFGVFQEFLQVSEVIA
uniref:DUF38 domain-containing protein n=1 Tax=Panagrolaimus sp. JU765 TaxID=591449 RepID=A0AC34REY3_9BILA